MSAARTSFRRRGTRRSERSRRKRTTKSGTRPAMRGLFLAAGDDEPEEKERVGEERHRRPTRIHRQMPTQHQRYIRTAWMRCKGTVRLSSWRSSPRRARSRAPLTATAATTSAARVEPPEAEQSVSEQADEHGRRPGRRRAGSGCPRRGSRPSRAVGEAALGDAEQRHADHARVRARSRAARPGSSPVMRCGPPRRRRRGRGGRTGSRPAFGRAPRRRARGAASR